MSERLKNNEEVSETLQKYLALENKFVDPPKITLKLISKPPVGELIGAESIAASTAIQCYAPGVAKMIERIDDKALGIAESTLEGGHHTTRLHTNYTWQIVGATRSVTHDVFHTTPFYNSEQQSQRYVEAKDGNYLMPKDLSPEQSTHFYKSADFANKSYFHMLDKLKPEVEDRVKKMNPEGGWKVKTTAERLNSKSQKLTQEIARYVLPIGQFTNYFHTLGELQLLRLFRASKFPNFTDEARFIIAKMITEVANHDQSILKELESPLTNNLNSYSNLDKEKFDSFLGGKFSKLVSSSIDDMREIDIKKSLKTLADVYDTGMFDPEVSTMRSSWLTFVTKISHAGDSQRQRHRRTGASAVDIESIYTGELDYITPLVIRKNPELSMAYSIIIKKMFENVDTAIKMNIPKEYALLLLPNAITVRVKEAGDLFDWVHRWKQRLCYLAQEEIFFASLDQVRDVEKIMPEIKQMLLAPCGIRMAVGVSPRCPEGSRWCGQPVYNWQLDQYEKNRLI